MSDTFPIQNGLKQGDALSPVIFSFALEYSIREAQESEVVLELNGTHQLLISADACYPSVQTLLSSHLI